MKKMPTLLWLCVWPVLLFGLARPHPEPKPLALTHVTVIDATGAPAQPDRTVVVTGDRIIALGPTGEVNVPKDAHVVDASSQFLIPGLWNMHIHSGSYEDGQKNFPILIANGITGVRDMGTPLDDILRLRQEAKEGKLLGPRMVVAGPLLQGPLPFQQPLLISVANEIEASQAVISLKKRGVDFIKVQDALPRNLYHSIARESKRQGIPFAGHIPPYITAMEATDAGQRSIEHLGGRFYGVLLACSTREAELTDKIRGIIDAAIKALAAKKPADDSEIFRARVTQPLLDSFSDQKAAALFARFAKNHTWQVPTLVTMRDLWNRKDLSEEDIRYGNRVKEKQLEMVRAMRRAGVRFMAGTDRSPGEHPSSLHAELALFVKAGFTPMEALQTATCNPAEYLDLLDSLGTVEKGKIADLVLLEANPLEDINNTQKIAGVVLRGQLISKSERQAMLGKADATPNKK